MNHLKFCLIGLILLADPQFGYSKNPEPIHDLSAALKKAKAENKLLFIIYGRDRCGNTMAVRNLVSQNNVRLPDAAFVYANINCDDQATRKLFYQLYKVEGNMLPFVVIADSEGKQLMARSGFDQAYAFNNMIKSARTKVGTEAPATTLLPTAKPTTTNPALPVDENREMRRWTSRSGSQIDASLVAEKNDQVILKKPDGAKVEIPLNRLSDDDQRYIQELKENGQE